MARAAAIQMVSGPDVEANLIEAERLIRRAADSGAELAVLPENLACVIAAGRAGEHASGRRSWGLSMIIDPWGDVLVSLESGPGVAVAELDPESVRERFPALSHRRLGTSGEGVS
ncbi:MAG TPA: nitrilase-related carbon-nitrogen hydrolase [Gammaproteobacteria bacterium]|nr:nitrilase-related carbon-nitrogen hydrolase [Gammaproteobacteria bacterium]